MGLCQRVCRNRRTGRAGPCSGKSVIFAGKRACSSAAPTASATPTSRTESACTAPAPRRSARGDIGVIAQSGAVLLALGNAVPHGRISPGSFPRETKPALGLADYMDYLVDDPKTAVIALFMETIRDPEGVADACRRARGAGKPVIALKVGRSELACRVAATHTGAIAGSDRTLDAFFRRWHVMRVNTLDELLETSILFSGVARGSYGSPRVGMSTVSGGKMGMLADICSDHGLEFLPFRRGQGRAPQRAAALMPRSPTPWTHGEAATSRKPTPPASASSRGSPPWICLSSRRTSPPIWRTNRCPVLGRGRSSSAVRAASGKPVVVVSNISGGIDPSIRKILDEGNVPWCRAAAKASRGHRGMDGLEQGPS